MKVEQWIRWITGISVLLTMAIPTFISARAVGDGFAPLITGDNLEPLTVSQLL